MAERIGRIRSLHDIRWAPVPQLLIEVKPEFQEIVQELNMECVAQNGHGYFWRLFIDRLNLAAGESLGEVEADNEADQEKKAALTKSIKENLAIILDDTKLAIDVTSNDPQFILPEFAGVKFSSVWPNRGISAKFEFLEGLYKLPAQELLGNIYDILYDILTQPQNS